MINNLTYEEALAISKELKASADEINLLIKDKKAQELQDFVSTVEGYSKYIETTVELHMDADKALQELKDTKK